MGVCPSFVAPDFFHFISHCVFNFFAFVFSFSAFFAMFHSSFGVFLCRGGIWPFFLGPGVGSSSFLLGLWDGHWPFLLGLWDGDWPFLLGALPSRVGIGPSFTLIGVGSSFEVMREKALGHKRKEKDNTRGKKGQPTPQERKGHDCNICNILRQVKL